jgi:hypothetical protein
MDEISCTPNATSYIPLEPTNKIACKTPNNITIKDSIVKVARRLDDLNQLDQVEQTVFEPSRKTCVSVFV